MAFKTLDKFSLIYILIVTAIFLSLVLYAASDLRGDDQYWYTAEVETILHGEPKTTNFLYPADILSSESLKSAPFIHNIPNLYFVVPAALLFGPFMGWVFTNIIASLITAYLIALVVYRVLDLRAAILSYSLYLLLPITIRQTSQPNAEVTTAFLTAIGVYAYLSAIDNKKFWLFLFAVACLAYYCRESFLPALFLIPAAYLIQNKPVKKDTVFCTLCLVLCAVIAVLGKITFFTSAGRSDWNAVLNIAIPGMTDNMYALFKPAVEPLQLKNILTKFAYNFVWQFWPKSANYQILFYLPFNTLAALSIWLYFAKKSYAQLRIAHCAIVLFLLHIVTIVLVQNTFRYLIALPPIVAGGIIMFNQFTISKYKRVQIFLLLAVLVLLTTANIPLAESLHRNGQKEGKIRTELLVVFDNVIAKDESVIVQLSDKEYHEILGYVLRPRKVLYVNLDYNYEQYQTFRRKINAKWLLCPKESPLVEFYGTDPKGFLTGLPYPYKNYFLFRIYSRTPKSGTGQLI